MPVTATAIAGGIQGVLGVTETIINSIKAKKLTKRLKPLKTSEKRYNILNATEQAAMGGFDPITLKFLTDQTGRGTAGVLGAATRLGADPNQLSAILDQNIQATMRIGAENHEKQMTNFVRYLGALEMVGGAEEAEQVSKNNIIKNQLKQAAEGKKEGVQNLFGGANAMLGAWANSEINELGIEESVENAKNGTTGSWVIGKNPDGSPHFESGR